jgi:hypothetical protein
VDEREHVEAKERAEKQLLDIPGVHAVGVGGKVVGGEPTGEPSITVFVERKLPLSEIPPEQRIPPEIDGVKTDVVEEPIPTILQTPGIPVGTERVDSSQYRPLLGGIQVARRGGDGFGTMGCICTVTGAPNRVIGLTNHHVVLNACADTPNNEEVGQPTGRSSSSESCHDIVGTLVDAQCDTDVDLALIQFRSGMQWLAEIQDDGLVAGTHAVTAAEAATQTFQVKKRGRTSGLTGGVVTAINVSGSVNNHDGTLHRTYTNGIRVRANPDPATPGTTDFALPGDSGSALRDVSDNVVGIVFGSSVGNGTSTAFPIQAAIDKFATGVPAARRVQLAVATTTTAGNAQTVPTAMVADEQTEPAQVPLSWEEAERLEEELRTSRQGAWYADLYRRHREEAAALVHSHRRVTVVWHRSGAAELFQWLWKAFTGQDVRVPEEIQGRSVRACLEDIAEALERHGSAMLQADVRRVLPTLPDIAGLTDREIVERLKGLDREKAPA